MTTLSASYDAQRQDAIRRLGPTTPCTHGMPLSEGCYTCLREHSTREIRRGMARVDRLIARLPAPAPRPRRGDLVAVADAPYEVVMVKADGTVYVKDEAGKVTGHAPSAVTVL